MKLSVVKNIENDFVSKVSEYANTQNKINKSDFFSSSPFHKEFKNYSKRIWVSATGGIQQRTHWFYERVRCEYFSKDDFCGLSSIERGTLQSISNGQIKLPNVRQSKILYKLYNKAVGEGFIC